MPTNLATHSQYGDPLSKQTNKQIYIYRAHTSASTSASIFVFAFASPVPAVPRVVAALPYRDVVLNKIRKTFSDPSYCDTQEFRTLSHEAFRQPQVQWLALLPARPGMLGMRCSSGTVCRQSTLTRRTRFGRCNTCMPTPLASGAAQQNRARQHDLYPLKPPFQCPRL